MASEGYWSKSARDQIKGQLVTLQVPEGHYEFFSVDAISSAGLAIVSARSMKPFSYPFQVKAGEAAYLGELHFKFDETRQPKDDQPVDVSYTIQVRDNRAEDFQDALRKIPGLPVERIVVRLLDSQATAAMSRQERLPDCNRDQHKRNR